MWVVIMWSTCISDTSSSETVDFKVIFNKQKFDVSMQVDSTIEQLKAKTQVLTGQNMYLVTPEYSGTSVLT